MTETASNPYSQPSLFQKQHQLVHSPSCSACASELSNSSNSIIDTGLSISAWSAKSPHSFSTFVNFSIRFFQMLSCSSTVAFTFPFSSFHQFTPKTSRHLFAFCFAIRNNSQPSQLISAFSVASLDV